jgi:hypothetical protein
VANETKHVKLSFEDRCRTLLEPETTVHYEGVDFDTTAVTEWIRPRDFGYSPIGESGVQPGVRRELWTFSFDVFVKVGLTGETTHRARELVDLIKASFDRINLSVLDWTGDHAQEALIYFNRGTFSPVLQNKIDRYVLEQVNVTYEGVLWA